MKRIDLIFLALVCLLTTAYGWWTISATRDYRSMVLEQKQDARQTKKALSLARTRLNEMEKAYHSLKEDMRQLTRYLSAEQKKESLFQRIDQLISSTGLNLVSLQPGQTKSRDGYRKKAVQIICNGQVMPMLELIRDLEDLDAPLVLDEVRIMSIEAENRYRLMIKGSLIRLPAEPG